MKKYEAKNFTRKMALILIFCYFISHLHKQTQINFSSNKLCAWAIDPINFIIILFNSKIAGTHYTVCVYHKNYSWKSKINWHNSYLATCSPPIVVPASDPNPVLSHTYTQMNECLFSI